MTRAVAWAVIRTVELSPDEARAELRRELAHPDYRERDLTERALNWVLRQVDHMLNAASTVPPLSYFAALVLGLVLALVLGLVLSRLGRRTHRTHTGPAPVLEEGLSADQLRARARTALEAGRTKEATLDAFRALATAQVEQRRIENLPGATAHELSTALAEAFAERRTEIVAAADLFDATLYGDQHVRREQAEALLALSSDLAGVA